MIEINEALLVGLKKAYEKQLLGLKTYDYDLSTAKFVAGKTRAIKREIDFLSGKRKWWEIWK